MEALILIVATLTMFFAGLTWWGMTHRGPWELDHVSDDRWVLRRTGYGRVQLFSVESYHAPLILHDDSGMDHLVVKRGYALVMDIDLRDPTGVILVTWAPAPRKGFRGRRRTKERTWIRQIIA